MFSRLFSRRRDQGWTSYAPGATPAGWHSSFPLSPAREPGHVVLRNRGGELQVLRGRQRSWPTDRFLLLDQRRRQLSFAPQSIPTAEGIDITLTFVLTVQISDPVRYLSVSADPDKDVYLAAQIAVRELISTLPLMSLITERIDLSPVGQAAAAAGLKVGMLVDEDVRLKDISLPYSVSEALGRAEVDKLNSDTELERARTEVKITRARLGTAKVLEQNPVLAKIRLLEALPPGTTLEIRGGELGLSERP